MFTKALLTAGTVISLAAAIPLQQHQKRDVVWTTATQVDYVTSIVYTTIYPGQSPGAHMPHGHGHANHHKPQITSHIMSTITVQPSAPAAPSVPAGSSPAAPASSAPPAQASQPAPMSSAPAQQMSQPAPSSPAPASPAAGHKKPHKSHGGSGGGGGGSAPQGQVHTGDITYYTPGLGSCGITSTSSQAIVALPVALMLSTHSANPNDNPFCGKTITISHGGTTAQATVVDTCEGCSGGSIDLSPTLFQTFAPLSVGRVSGVQWSFN